MMKNTNSKHLSQIKNGFIDCSKIEFVGMIRENIDDIRKEINNNSPENMMVKSYLGFESSWTAKVAGDIDISKVVEDWIAEGGFHEKQIGYDSRDGEWKTLPLWKSNDNYISKITEKYYPKTYELLKKIPNLHFAAIFKQPPGCKIKKHRHSIPHMIFHFLLNDLKDGDAEIKVDNQRKFLKFKGDCIAFDYTHNHSSQNNSKVDRINLVLDIK